MKFSTTIATLLFSVAALASTPHKYRLVWQDNFNGNTYDKNSWTKIPRGGSDWDRHMADTDSLYAVRDGKLILRGTVNTNLEADTARFVTGGLYTKHKRTIKHGKVEVRAKFGSAQGAWPAIWMLPDADIQWPEGGEIDIMEHLNHDNIAYQTVHTYYTYVLKKDQNPPHGSTLPITATDSTHTQWKYCPTRSYSQSTARHRSHIQELRLPTRGNTHSAHPTTCS